jgi:hypothetical protein
MPIRITTASRSRKKVDENKGNLFSRGMRCLFFKEGIEILLKNFM